MSRKPTSGGGKPPQSSEPESGLGETAVEAPVTRQVRAYRIEAGGLNEPAETKVPDAAPTSLSESLPELPFGPHAIKAFADSALVRRLNELEDDRPQIKGKRYVWTSPSNYLELDPHTKWTEEKRRAEQAVRQVQFGATLQMVLRNMQHHLLTGGHSRRRWPSPM
jgi:hypothetical protein